MEAIATFVSWLRTEEQCLETKLDGLSMYKLCSSDVLGPRSTACT